MASRTPRAPLHAYVLHSYAWSESSLILDLFTREHGRLAVVAKGAKRPYSQLRAVLLPFQRIHATLGRMSNDEGASDVQTLRGAEWAGGAAMLTGAALFSGFYANELLMKLLARHDPHAALFDAYAHPRPALAANDAASQAALRAFELTLLREIGVLPDLSVQTLTQQPVNEAQRYTLLAEAGVGAARAGEGDVPGTLLIGLQAALVHGSVPALQQACALGAAGLKGLLRGMIQHHLGNSVLRTRQVMAGVRDIA